VRCDAVFADAIAMATFNGLGDIGSVGGYRFRVVRWFTNMRRIRGGRGGGGWGGGGGVVEGCGADGGGCSEPRELVSCGAIRVCNKTSTTYHVNRDDVFSVSFVRCSWSVAYCLLAATAGHLA
jgi:hypothetical protein